MTPTSPTKAICDTTTNHLANERTFLAWIRTSISIIVFGFVVSRFGIALKEFFLVQNRAIKDSNTSLSIGVGFMVVGIVMALISLVQYHITRHRIETNQFKPANLITILLGAFAALFGITLVIYLILTAQNL